jgi:hypothetical protein
MIGGRHVQLLHRIVETATKYGRRPAIQVLRGAEIETTTYDELVIEVAALLVADGGRPGAGRAAAILADNDARWVATYLGILWMGGVAVPLDTAYKATEYAVLESSGRAASDDAEVSRDGSRGRATLGDTAPRVETLGALDRDQTARLFDAPSMAVLLYVGHDRRSEGVVLTHDNLDAERIGALAIVDAGPDDAVLGVLPLFHALAQMANLLLPLTVGARVVFLESVDQLDDAARGAAVAGHHDLRVRAAVLLSHPSTRADRGGARRPPAARGVRGAARHERLAARSPALEARTPSLRTRASRAWIEDAAAHHGWIAIRPGDRARSLRHGLLAAQRVRADGDIGRRDDRAAWRSLHDVGWPAVSWRGDPNRDAPVGVQGSPTIKRSMGRS